LKPARLDAGEVLVIRRHAEHGYRILEGSTAELLKLASIIAWTHHEHFDGRGYPRGLKGEDIAIEGRMAAIADVFDALTSVRPYKAAYTTEQALGIMKQARGEHFDPTLLDLFLDKLDAVLAIQQQYVSAPINN
jgi:response regulator RpfG family c-di-GMP phosphodiesterase